MATRSAKCSGTSPANAVQAMPGGGVLTIRTEQQDGAYRIVFADNGRGMSHADQQRLFQPFRTNFPSGTGLGMAISYRIVQEHGGNIDVQSVVGAGTRIMVTLPARQAARDKLPAWIAS
jgi:signal transduction histidine kinase